VVGLAPYLTTWAQGRGLAVVQDAAVGRFTRQQSVTSVPANSIVFVSLGTNDATSNVDGSALWALMQALRARSPRAIVWLLPPATKALPGLVVMRGTIQSLGVVVAQIASPLRSDGLHPVSYAQAFQDVLPALESVI
jgi:lysophospholipase L1-like esterase